mgnify:FL=1
MAGHRSRADRRAALRMAAVMLLAGRAYGATPALVEAAAIGDTRAVKRLLDAGTEVNARDARGRNAVLAATQGHHVETARLLIGRGADVSAQDTIEDSAFLLAGASGLPARVDGAARSSDPR